MIRTLFKDLRGKILIVLILAGAAAFWYFQSHSHLTLSSQTAQPVSTNSFQATTSSPTASNPAASALTPIFSEALSAALSRVTKKPFGIRVTPQNSPVSPERFSGYHTGADFEILPGEENIDVPILAVCAGPLIYKNYVSGYGGVAIEQCEVNGETVTVLYGHLRLSSIIPAVGADLTAREQLGVLGTGYSAETDGERKHLHLAIHKGSAIELKGYVQTQNELAAWLDPLPLMR